MTSEEEQIRDVERSLDAGATRHHLRTRRTWNLVGKHTNRDERVHGELGLWLCACYSHDAPTWLVFGDDKDLAWCRVPDRIEPCDIVDADLQAGSHTSVHEVLQWLRGETALPGDYAGEPRVANRIAKRLNQ